MKTLACLKSALLLGILLLVETTAWPQMKATNPAPEGTCPSTPSQIPASNLLVEHTNFFCPPTVYDLKNDSNSSSSFPAVNYTVYSAVGYDLANSMMLVGPKGVVIIDTLGDARTAQTVIQKFESILKTSTLPVKAVIYTHNHIDHVAGVDAFVQASGTPACPPDTHPDDRAFTARDHCVEVLAQANIIDGLAQTATISGTIINPRSVYMYGSFIGDNRINDGIGPKVSGSVATFHLPSRLFNQRLEFTAAGITMELVYVPSETNDELMVFVPDNKNGVNDDGGLLFSAEVIQGPSFPNLYSLRGTAYRSPATWFESVDTLRNYNSWCMVPSHGVPLCGASNIQTLLVNFRDAIQFTHDQTVRFMNQGFTPDELVDKVSLPPYLQANLQALQAAMPAQSMSAQDYLREFYGSVRQSVRQIYFGYLGWFSADPVDLNPTPPRELAAGYVALIGKDKMEKAAADALTQGQYQWAAELATLLIRADHENFNARKIKAKAFRQLAITVTNPNWRNWYLSAAVELCFQPGKIEPDPNGPCLPFPLPSFPRGLTSPDFIANLPPDKWVNSWTIRWKPNSDTTQLSLGFQFPDEGPGRPQEQYILQANQAVVRFMTSESPGFNDAWKSATTLIQITRHNLLVLLRNEAALVDLKDPHAFTNALVHDCDVGNQGLRPVKVIRGTCGGLKDFADLFDQPETESPKLTIR